MGTEAFSISVSGIPAFGDYDQHYWHVNVPAKVYSIAALAH